MTPEELNREIAEKLMGLEVIAPIGKMQSIKKKGIFINSTPVLNYFTEGWEQVEDAVSKYDILYLRESELDVEAGEILHRASWVYVYDKERYLKELIGTHLSSDRENANFGATRQAWPNIIKRIKK